jgi:hypothetical protein
MKRALLIAGGTVGGLGAVLAITPPQFTSTQSVDSLSGGLPMGGATQTTPAATQPAQTPAATKATPTKSAVATKPSSGSANTQQPAPAPAATQSAVATPSASGYSGTVTGASFNARNYGTLSATVTFSNGKISNVTASQSPRSWSENVLSAVLPFVNGGKITIEQVKQYSAAQLPCGTSNSCRSQASFTADAFWSSVKSAISKAGL